MPCFFASMKKRVIQFLAAAPAFAFRILCSGRKEPVSHSHEGHIDTTITVYGAYTPILLRVTKGIKITNPIQIGLGPGAFIHASNQSGEVYSLRDTDGDGLEDMALLYCDDTNYALMSPRVSRLKVINFMSEHHSRSGYLKTLTPMAKT